jgi:hypothetical protein
MNVQPHICLVTPGHVGSTPRLVKNADALSAAGYRVHVVAGRHFPPVDALDASLFREAKWTYSVVDMCGGIRVFARKLLRRFARRQLRTRHVSASLRLAARAHHAETIRLGRFASRVPAQLYLGHCLAGLPAAALAAKARGARYAFDAEDFHDGEEIDEPGERHARRILQSRLLPGCAFTTAASPMIAARYRELYGIDPTTLLNVFPLSEAPEKPFDPPPVSSSRPARFYWFSQTIGPGRGLEAILAVVVRMRTPVELRLRGFVQPDYAAHLRELARGAGRGVSIEFLPPAPPAEMTRLAADADLGLSLEQTTPIIRDLCLTNKIFVYLLAGLPQLLSHTSAQAAFARELGSAALAAELGRVDDVAHVLDAFLSDPARIAESRRTAWKLGRSRYNWDLEQTVLLKTVAPHLPQPS